jgi:hypothetical protein
MPKWEAIKNSIKLSKMKTLQSFKSVAISEFEMKHFTGGLGAPVSGSCNIMGSTFSYSGTVDLTADNSTSLGPFSSTSYVSDFCGSGSFDGGNSIGCLQYRNGTWVMPS